MIKLKDLIKEEHKITFTKDEMAKLHKDGKLEKDGHTYLYNEISEDFGSSAKQMKGYSSKEAKSIIDGALKNYAKVLRKAQYRIIADWMRGAKSGAFDFFDLVRGFQTGDASRAHPYETKFLKSVLDRDKIMDRFRKYFGGKKGKRERRK